MRFYLAVVGALLLMGLVVLALVRTDRSQLPGNIAACRALCDTAGAPGWSYNELNGCTCGTRSLEIR